ncbi:hypothetical protein HZA97_07245 [Candidatus Woesearchaeota archaeon]|nr:hypothetical protein [Candidatus Woesearchaeota archaeon]
MENKNLEEKITRAAHKMFSAILKRKIAEINELDEIKEYTEAIHPLYQQKRREDSIFLERYTQVREKLESDCKGLAKVVCDIEGSLQKINNYNRNNLINHRKNFFPKPGDNYGKM